MATSNGGFIPLSDEDLIAVGILPKKPKIEETKTGCSVKETKFDLIKVDQNYLEELRLEAAPRDYKNFPIEKGFLKPTSSVTKNNRNSTSVYSMKRSSIINRRTSTVQKDIAKKAVSNLSYVVNNSNQKNGGGKFIPITPLDALEEESRKASVRKKLFRTSLSKNKPDKLSKGPRSSIKSTFINSPLPDINKVESLLKKNSSLKSVGQQNQFLLNTATRLSVVQEERQSLTPSKSGSTSESKSARSSTSSTTEFESMEQLCNQQNVKEVNNKIDKVLEIIKIHQEEFEKYKEANERRLKEITNLLKEIIETSKIPTEKKEGQKKKILKMSTPKITPIKSEKLANKSNLRKNVLMMSVGRSQGNTPKEKKAERMYNSLRDRYGILETPKFDRKTPGEGNKNISMKLQEQCLMLLDTPQH